MVVSKHVSAVSYVRASGEDARDAETGTTRGACVTVDGCMGC